MNFIYKQSSGLSQYGRTALFIFIMGTVLTTFFGCFPSIKLLPDAGDPLEEYVLEGDGRDKVAVINVNGVISDKTHRNLMSRETPSLLQEVIAQLQMAEKDPAVKAVVIKIDSPGGTVTASDILYKRIMDYRQSTGATVVAAMMDIATSGGYYIALPADQIVAHPTTVTGSIGVVFILPKFNELLDTIGIEVNTHTSGRNKDMGSPFRDSTKEEEAIFDNLINTFARRFLFLVEKHRKDRNLSLNDIKSARIFTADEALAVGLIDRIGYLEEAIASARQIAGLPENARVICYRRAAYPNDTIYNTLSTRQQGNVPSLINIDLLDFLPTGSTGFFYLWWPSYGNSASP